MTIISSLHKDTQSVEAWSERWEQGFRRAYYRGRTGGYYESESGLSIDFWTLPEILTSDNTIEPSPWNNVVRLRNSKNGTTVDPIYFGLNRPLRRGILAFEAKLPTTGNLLFIGFEVNSGGSFAHLVSLHLENNQWKIRALNQSRNMAQNVSIRHPNVYARYVLLYDPPFIELYQAPEENSSGYPLELTNFMYIYGDAGKVIPFFANEQIGSVNEFRVGNIWVYEIPPLRHRCELINTASIQGNGEAHIDIEVKSIKELVFTVKVTYGAAATQGIRVYFLGSAEGGYFDSENTTDAFKYFEPSFQAGQMRQKSYSIDSELPQFIRVLIRNLDNTPTGNVLVQLTGRGLEY